MAHQRRWTTSDGFLMAHQRRWARSTRRIRTIKKQDEYEVHRKRREVIAVADDDTSSGSVDLTKRLGISISIYATTSKAQVPTEKAMPSLPGATWHEGPPPKMAMLSPPPKKVDASSAAATRSVSKAAVASSAAAAIDNRHSTIGVAKAAGARSAAAAASSAAASSAAASSDGAAIGNRQSTVDNRQSTIDSSGGEAWRTTRQDITVWNEVLTANGVDKAACQDLFLLAQHSSDGYKEANHIISKLIKKQQDKQLVTNTSAFVHKCVLNVRHKLMSQANDSWSEYKNAGWMDAYGEANPFRHWR